MFCRMCKSFFKVKRSFKELFINKIYYLCPKCKESFILELNYNVIPIFKYNIKILTLYKKLNLNYLIYDIDRYSKIIHNLYLKKVHIFFVDKFYEDDLYEYIIETIGEEVLILSFK